MIVTKVPISETHTKLLEIYKLEQLRSVIVHWIKHK